MLRLAPNEAVPVLGNPLTRTNGSMVSQQRHVVNKGDNEIFTIFGEGTYQHSTYSILARSHLRIYY